MKFHEFKNSYFYICWKDFEILFVTNFNMKSNDLENDILHYAVSPIIQLLCVNPLFETHKKSHRKIQVSHNCRRAFTNH